MNSNEAYYVGKKNHNRVDAVAREIMQTGVKQKDAWHLHNSNYPIYLTSLSKEDFGMHIAGVFF